MKNIKFKVSGMSCAACSARVDKAVSSLEGVDSCEVNLLLGEMSVTGSIDDAAVILAVERAGYGAKLLGELDNDADGMRDKERAEIKALIKRLVASAILLFALMYISMGYAMWGFPVPNALEIPVVLGVAELVLTSIIMVINKRFFVNGVRGVLNLAPNMDTLVSLGSFVSYVYSIVLLFGISDAHSTRHALHGLYFESAAMILVLITLGKLLESIAKGKTTSAIRSLMDLTPKTAIVIREGREVEIPVRDIVSGDLFVVKKGVNIACDGRVAEGEISINESALTGEALPRDASVGDTVFGATSVLSGWAIIEAEKVGEKTAIEKIVKMVKEASSSKAPVAKAADKIAGIFVPSVLLISLVTFVLWMIFGGDISRALNHAVTVLVISCPCALGLATPVAVMVGTGVGARHGILFKNAASLEASGRIKTVALDKTGTVTEGKPEVGRVVSYGVEKDELISIAMAIEEKSEHPLASAVVSLGKSEPNVKKYECKEFEAFVGGVSGVVNGVRYYIGNERFINEKLDLDASDDFLRLKSDGMTVLAVAEKGSLIGVIGVSDKIKADSQAAVAALHSLGIKTVMITGDNSSAANNVAGRVGIDTVISDVLPADKANAIKKLKSNGSVAMVGDGINDSVALTEADVGIALSAGADIAMDSSDVVLTRGSLMSVASAVRLGRRTLLNVYENLFWAFSYNVIGIPLAAGVFDALFGWTLSPMFGAMAMSISSFTVVMNALRLNLYNPDKSYKNKNNSLQKTSKIDNTGVKTVITNSTDTKTEISVKSTDPSNVSTAVKNVPIIADAVKTNVPNTDSTVKINKEDIKERNGKMNNVVIKIEGMMCPHCSGRVKMALEASELVASADVSHERGDAVITLRGEASDNTVEALKEIILTAGYKVI